MREVDQALARAYAQRTSSEHGGVPPAPHLAPRSLEGNAVPVGPPPPLNEEVSAAEKITAAAQPILKESAQQPEEPKKPKSAKEKYSAQKSKEDENQAAPDLQKHVG